jgi:hypothetical protein
MPCFIAMQQKKSVPDIQNYGFRFVAKICQILIMMNEIWKTINFLILLRGNNNMLMIVILLHLLNFRIITSQNKFLL